MKNKILVSALLVVFILASCAPKDNPLPTETAIPASPTLPAPTKTATFAPTRVPTPTFTLPPLPVLVPGKDDYLIYVVQEDLDSGFYGMGDLMLFDPVTGVHTPILPGWVVGYPTVNEKDRLAFSALQDGESEIYVLDYPFTENVPVKITHDPSSEKIPFSWSPDGKYLAFQSEKSHVTTLSIWDGNTIMPIYQNDDGVGELDWSSDGKLAFTEFDALYSIHGGDFADIYIWDGTSTIDFSQNKNGEDRFPTWNHDGRMAFISERNGKDGVYIWDGISKSNGVPDSKTYRNITPNMTDIGLWPVWTNTDLLTFVAHGSQDTHYQIYQWDGQTAINISQNPGAENGGQSWRSDGYWSFVSYFSSENLVYVLDEKNNTVLSTKGWFYPDTPAWSSSGLLLFCVSENKYSHEFSLSMWNGTEVIEILRGPIIRAVWRNGNSVFCTNG